MSTLTAPDYDHGTWGGIPAQWGDVAWGGQLTVTVEGFDAVATIEAMPGHVDSRNYGSPGQVYRTVLQRRWALYFPSFHGQKYDNSSYPSGEILVELVPAGVSIQSEATGGLFRELEWGQPWTMWGTATTSWGGHFTGKPAGTIVFEHPVSGIDIEAGSGQSLISKPSGFLHVGPAKWYVPFLPTRTTWALPLTGEILVEVEARSGVIETACLTGGFVGMAWGGYTPLIAGWGKKGSTWGGMTDREGAWGEAVTASISPGNKTYT